MRFGGHESFHLRPGWVTKGMALIQGGHQGSFDRPETSDALGVGRNMALSIAFWLQATGLASRNEAQALELTPLGRLVWRRDRYLDNRATLWALHTNLVTDAKDQRAWRWFFNEFEIDRFDRDIVAQKLEFALLRGQERMPADNTLRRDIACILASYAGPGPNEREDPDEGPDCPFRSLGILGKVARTGQFRRRLGKRILPPELLGYVLAKGRDLSGPENAPISFVAALVEPCGPGRVLALDEEGLATLISDAERELPRDTVRTHASAGERMVSIVGRSHVEWLDAYYKRVGA